MQITIPLYDVLTYLYSYNCTHKVGKVFQVDPLYIAGALLGVKQRPPDIACLLLPTFKPLFAVLFASIILFKWPSYCH